MWKDGVTMSKYQRQPRYARVYVRLSRVLDARLRRYAYNSDRSLSDIVREALSRYLPEMEV